MKTGPSAHLPAPFPTVPGKAIRLSHPARPGSGLMDTRVSHLLNPWMQTVPDNAHKTAHAGRLGETKTNVVVPVVRVVPVAVRRTGVPRFVVPGTAADHTLAAFRPAPLVNRVAPKITRRKPDNSTTP